MVVGLVDDWTCEEAEVRLDAGDTLVVYSDGITEAADRDGQEFGEGRVVDVVGTGSMLAVEPLGRHLRGGALQRRRAGRRSDDPIARAV